MSAILIIIAYILVICEAVWYFTCTEHKDVPLILVLFVLILSIIPGFNLIMSIANAVSLSLMISEDVIELKNNWFNRVFLAHYE